MKRWHLSVLEVRMLCGERERAVPRGGNSVAILWEEVQRLLSWRMALIKAEDAGGTERRGLE